MQDQELRKKAADLKNNLSRLMEKRSNWEVHWQEVADYMLPRKADITLERPKGDKRNTLIFDGTAIHSLELLASSLHGMLTSSVNRWFGLRFKETNVNQNDEAREWLEDVTDKMYLAISRSNFQQEVFETYFDLIGFGTSCLQIEEDKDDIIRFSSRHIKEIYISEDAKGLVNCIYRRFKMTAKATVEKFGLENLSSKVQNTFKKSQFEDIDLCHVVKPRDMYNPRKEDKQNMPYVSCYFEYDSGHIISEGGFREFPYVVPRYLKASHEIYGRSPAMTALPDVKMLNEMSKTTIKAAQKQVDPPLLVPDDGFLLPVRTVPGGLNFYRSGTRDRIEPLNIGANNPLGLNMEEQRRDSIRAVFYVNQLMMQQGPQMTATEVIQRNEEKMRLLGPVLGRLQSELLKPLIDRVFAILLRKDMLPPAPEFLSGRDIEIEYVSPLAKAQKSSELQSIMRAIEILGSLANISPVFDYVNFDNLVKHLADIVGMPQKLLKSQNQVNAEREQAAAQAAEQQQMAQMQQVAQAGGDIAPLAKALPEEAKALVNSEVE